MNYMDKQAIQQIINTYGNLNETIDSLDLLKSEKCMETGCQQYEFRIGCPNCHRSNIKNLNYFFKHKLEDLQLQTVDYKPHFKTQCFNCLLSFHGSCFEDGYFNLQKMIEVAQKCANCQRQYTTERSFYHNCNICNASFKNCKLLVHHRRKEHNSKKTHQCAACHLSLATSYVNQHIYKHRLPYICPYCSKRYSVKKNLTFHMLSHTGEKPFSCKYCLKQYKTKQYLDIHVFEHTGDKQFKCDACDKSFAMQHLLNKHKSYHMDKSFQCKYCPKVYKGKKCLDAHLFEHIGCKKFKCNLCGKSFAKQYLVNRHKLIHKKNSIVKLFSCKYCPKQYATKQNFNNHLFDHTGGKPFKCDLCDKTFAKPFLLNQHKFIHMENSFQCTFCSNIYKTPANVRRHIKTAHKLQE